MWERVRKALLASLSVSSMRLWKWVRAFWSKNGLLTLSMLSVATGCLLGFLLRALELTELVRCWGRDRSERVGPAVRAATEGHGHKSKGFSPRKDLLDGFCLWLAFYLFVYILPKSCRTNLVTLCWEWGLCARPRQAAGACRRDGDGKGGLLPHCPQGLGTA